MRQQVRPHLGGLQVGHAHPVQTGHRRQRRQQADQRARAARQVLAVGGGVLAHQHHLADPLPRQPRRLAQHVVRGPGDERAAERRNRAERAPAVAPRGQLQRRVGLVRQPHPREVGHPGVAGHRDVVDRGGPLHRRDRQQRAPVDRDVRGRGVAAEDVAEAGREVRVGVETEHGVGLGQALGQLRAVPLGEAAHGDDLRARLLRDVRRGEQGVDGVLLGLLDEPAGVDHDDVRRGVVRVEVDQLPAAAVQPPRELLGVDLVARAAQGEQGGTPPCRLRFGNYHVARVLTT